MRVGSPGEAAAAVERTVSMRSRGTRAGYQPSAPRIAVAVARGPRAATQIGRSGRAGTPRRRPRPPPVGVVRSPSSRVRTWLRVWASRAAGRWKATSWNCLARVGVLVPRPRVNRPAGEVVEGGGHHGDRGGAASPDRCDAGGDADAGGLEGDLGEDDAGVESPPFGDEDGVVVELVGEDGGVDNEVAALLHRGEDEGPVGTGVEVAQGHGVGS